MLENRNEIIPEAPKKKGISPQVRRIILFFAFFLLGLMCLLIWRFLQRPAMGTIHPGKTLVVSESFDGRKEKKRYSGKYVDFSYTAAYLERRHDLPVNSPIKESISLSAEDIEGRKITLIVADRGTSDLASDPSFQIRNDTSGEYQSKPLQIANFQGMLFQKNTQIFEVTAFFPYQGHIMSISVTSPFSLEGLETELFDIVESLHLTLD